MKMSKKIVAGALLCGTMLATAVPAFATSSLPSVASTPGSIVLEENSETTDPVDPTDPTKPNEPEDPDNPSTGNEGPLSLDVAPRAFDFGTQKMYQDAHTYPGVVTTDPANRDQQYLQVTDNREADVTGWTVTVKQDHELSNDTYTLTGAYITLPQAEARNSLNTAPATVDTSFTTVGTGGQIITGSELTVFSPTATTVTKGKATSTSLWKASEVSLTIPAGIAKAGNYTNNVE